MGKNKVCKSCKKPLPDEYKGKYCQSCMNNQVDKGKNIFKVVSSILTVFIMIITFGRKGGK